MLSLKESSQRFLLIYTKGKAVSAAEDASSTKSSKWKVGRTTFELMREDTTSLLVPKLLNPNLNVSEHRANTKPRLSNSKRSISPKKKNIGEMFPIKGDPRGMLSSTKVWSWTGPWIGKNCYNVHYWDSWWNLNMDCRLHTRVSMWTFWLIIASWFWKRWSTEVVRPEKAQCLQFTLKRCVKC